MIAVAPTLALRSAAICGNSESVTRTMACVAKPAMASRTMALVALPRAKGRWSGKVDSMLFGRPSTARVMQTKRP
jgi:hypothetical protein